MNLAQKIEAVLKGYLSDPNRCLPPLAAVPFFTGRGSADLPNDRVQIVTVEVTQDQEVASTVLDRKARVQLLVSTQGDDSTADLHEKRVAQVADFLDDVNALRLALNPPASGPDARVIKDFYLYDIWYDGPEREATETAWEDLFTLFVVCLGDSGTNPPS